MTGMKEENWIRNTNPIRGWLNEQEETKKTMTISNTIELGDEAESDEMRAVYWTAIRNMGKGCDGFPQSNIGKPSSHPQFVQANATFVKNRLYNAFVDIGEPELVLEAILPHGRTGGSYATIEDWAMSMAEKGEKALYAGYKAKPQRWDGELVDGLTGMVAPALKPKKTATTEVSEEE